MTRVERVFAREILDSRGSPTVEAEVTLAGGSVAVASVPAGASTGTHEARELRDGDPARYRGRGVRKAVAAIHDEIADALAGIDSLDQQLVDQTLIELDGTPDKSRLGANTILAVSLATARACAKASGVPLWRHLGGEEACLLPLPMVNVVSGGLHARRQLDFQDFMVVPVGATTFPQALEMVVAVRDATAELLNQRGLSTMKADEGGFGPALSDNRAALDLLVAAVEHAGYAPGEDVALALDVAATHFYDPAAGQYRLTVEGCVLDASLLIDVLEELVADYPIVSMEDPLAEDDWEGWQEATRRLGSRVQVVGDDLFTTNPDRLRRGIDQDIANAVLVKMNQIGSVTETREVVRLAYEAGYRTIVSARSGETEDAALADLAVAFVGGQIKVGSVAQSERLAKYNRLLRIEDELGSRVRFAGRAALAR